MKRGGRNGVSYPGTGGNNQESNDLLDEEQRTNARSNLATFVRALFFLLFAIFIISTFIMVAIMYYSDDFRDNGGRSHHGGGDGSEGDFGKHVKMCCFDPECVDDEASECWTHVAVLGGGSGGSTAAKLLSDVLPGGKRFSVVVLEKGQNYNSEPVITQAVTGGVPYFLFSNGLTKFTNTFNQESMSQLPNYVNVIGQGDMLGGTGNHDFLLVVEPSEKMAQRLQQESGSGPGDIQWDHTTLRSLSHGYENYGGPASPCSRGSGGNRLDITNLQVDFSTNAGSKLAEAIISNVPVDSSTIPHGVDYNCNSETSFTEHMQLFMTQSEGNDYLRSSPGLLNFGPDVMDANGFGVDGRLLRVITGAFVTKFETNSVGRATKVEAIVNGRRKIIHVKRQIVTSLGSIYTPGFFERSGYGHQDVLRAAGINVVKHMPDVGEGLQQHYGSGVFLKVAGRPVGTDFFLTGQGLLSVLPETNGTRSMQVYVIPSNLFLPGSTTLLTGADDIDEGEAGVFLMTNLLQADARGSVHITSPSPFQNPQVRFGAYEAPTGTLDIDLMTNITVDIFNALESLNDNDSPNVYTVLYPPRSAFDDFAENNDLSSLIGYIKGLPVFQGHYSSTFQMGKVLNANLEFLGADGITVADCSAWPIINNGNTRTQAILTATQAAKRLLATMASP